MRIEQLHYFLDVARTQSITRSANSLFISPQGLSQAISSLEKEYGMTFFERSKNGLVLNDKGSAFQKLAEELCRDFDRFESAVADLNDASVDGTREKLSLLLPPIVILGDAFGPMMDRLEHAFPAVDFSVLEKNLDQVIGRLGLIAEQKDCAVFANIPDFRRGELLHCDDVEVDVFLEMPIVAKVHKDSPLSTKKYLTKQDLSALPLVCFNEPIMESVIMHMVQEYGEPNIVMKGSTSRMLRMRKDAVAISAGIVGVEDDTVVVPIVDSATLGIAALYPRHANDLVMAVTTTIRRFLVDRYPRYKLEA